MGRSNIDVKSNIYIRAEGTYSRSMDSPEKDERFASQVLDADCLRMLVDRAEENETDLNITDAQWQLLVVRPCGFCTTGEMTHGLVRHDDGTITVENRCTVENCVHADMCGRTAIPADEKPAEDDLFQELAQLGMDIQNIFADPEGESADNAENADAEEPADSGIREAVAEIMKDKAEYFEISDTDAVSRVINAPLSDKIIVNGTAGTGKTFTAVERVTRIFKEPKFSEKYPRILMLCCTDNTANEIKTRIEQKIAAGELPESASRIALGTIDVLVMKYLADKGVSVASMRGMPLEKRAAMFREKLSPEDFALFDYAIIDELHEAADERAQVLLSILKSLKCGFLLLEDKCQAVFDYSDDNAEIMNCAALYSALRKALPNDVKKYTLLGNKRQSETLDKMTGLLRSQLLDDTPAQISAVCKKQLSDLPQALVDDDFKIIDLKGTTAILCRKNGDAEYISWLLNKNKVRHTLIRENAAGASIGRYLADVLWDYHLPTIERAAFVKRFTMRCDPDEGKANEFYSALVVYADGLSDEENDILDCVKLAEKLCCGGELPAVILNAREEMLTISTISRARGKEFDKVYLLGYDFSPNGESRNRDEKMFYLAETRPKNELEILRHPAKWTFKRSENNRWIRTVREAYKEHSKCVGFGTGDSEDIDYYSFVEGDLGSAIQRQAYIAQFVKCGDEVYLRVNGDVYDIVHGEMVIGKMSRSYSENLLGEFGGRKYVETLPERISELFVTNIITFVSLLDPNIPNNTAESKIPDQFRKKRFWLGVEISGFGTINE